MCQRKGKRYDLKKFRSRNFNLVLYPEDETHKKAIELISKNYDCAFILHDKDQDKEGNIKKEHWHVVIKNNNAKWNTALAEELGIEVNYIEECRNLKRSLLYLIHFYDEDKYQYSIDEVHGNLKDKIITYINSENKTESEKVLEILTEIDNIHSYIDYCIFIKHIAKIGYWDVLRRSNGIITRYLDIHNQHFSH